MEKVKDCRAKTGIDSEVAQEFCEEQTHSVSSFRPYEEVACAEVGGSHFSMERKAQVRHEASQNSLPEEELQKVLEPRSLQVQPFWPHY